MALELGAKRGHQLGRTTFLISFKLMAKPPKRTQPTQPGASPVPPELLDLRKIIALEEQIIGQFSPDQEIDPLDRAEDLVHEAMEARTVKRKQALLREALAQDPENIKALQMTLDLTPMSEGERLGHLREIVLIAAAHVGEDGFQDLVPHFWGFYETKLYLRSLERVAEALRGAGLVEEAIVEYEEMLRLNVGDNQGARYSLLPLLLRQHQLEKAKSLLDRFPGERKWNAVFAWSAVLERVLAGEEAEAVMALAAARQQNIHVEKYVNGLRKLPKNLPSHYSPGSKEEAICYGEPLAQAWRQHPGALAWLARQTTPGKAAQRGANGQSSGVPRSAARR